MDELIKEFNNTVCDMKISRKDKMTLLRMITVIGYQAKKAAEANGPKRGTWENFQQGIWVYAKCSICETVHDVKSNFCPHCGARMEES